MRSLEKHCLFSDCLRAANEDVVEGNVNKLDNVADGTHDYSRR